MKKFSKKYRILIAGGGTGGHLFPAIAIANELKSNDFKVRYIGSKNGIESKYDFIDRSQIDLLDITGLYRSITLKNILRNLILPYKLLKSYFKVKNIIKRFKPHVVIGTGGYSCALPLYVASKLKIKTAIQEQNVIPGTVTQLFHKKVDLVFTSFIESGKYLNGNNIVLTGNPLRSSINCRDKNESKNKIGLDPNKFVILVIGGSQGALAINECVLNSYKKLVENDIQIIWQTGENFKELDHVTNNQDVKTYKFINDMGLAYSASDLIVSRAGATAISEILYLGKPSILIPYPHAANNHQDKNADVLAEKLAAIKINQSNFNSDSLESEIIKFSKSKERCESFSNNAKNLSICNSSQKIKQKLEELISNAR